MLTMIAAITVMPISYLGLSCDAPVITLGESPAFKMWISNKGRSPMLVVQPNDGSDWHWRTPYTGWVVKPMSDKTEWPERPPKATTPRCGNMNPLLEKEVIEVQPGQSVEIDQAWLHQKPEFKEPGKYRVVFYYWHNNARPQKGPTTPSDTDHLLKRIMSSEPYRLRSNEVVITVRAPKAG